MSKDLFDGPTIILPEMLEARESRAAAQKEILTANHDAALLSATMNIPGPVKNSPTLKKIFEEMIETIESRLFNVSVAHLYRSKKTGPEYYLAVSLTSQELKKQMVTIEETHPYGRLMDLDVLWLEDGDIKSVSRQELGLPRRRCYVCQQDAKECGRSRKHTIAEMHQAIATIINNGKGHCND